MVKRSEIYALMARCWVLSLRYNCNVHISFGDVSIWSCTGPE